MSEVKVHEVGALTRSFLEGALDGLSRPQKALPCEFLYDKTGSDLFEQICELPEYYQTRTELGILRAHARDIGALIGPRAVVFELGSGSSVKTPLLLDSLEAPAAYVPIDVSRDYLVDAAAAIAARYPAMRVEAVWGDYRAPQLLPDIDSPRAQVAFFPGSTIGNSARREAIALLKRWRAHLGASGLMVVGVDLKKDTRVLERAYDDARGVTAAFIANVLVRANRELGADFDVKRFRYDARYDEASGAVRMHLVSEADQQVSIAGREFHIAAGEAIHIEDSHKYAPEEFAGMAAAAGFGVRRSFVDPHKLFSVQILGADG